MTDWGKIAGYGAFIAQDPFRIGLHYPAVQRELGDVRKRILDIGCGDGLFAMLLAVQGARVVGYDKAAERIAEATEKAHDAGLPIAFVIATPATFATTERFDAATSVMALNYATSHEELALFFSATCRHLIPGGTFASVVLNPTFAAFGEDLIVRRIHRLSGGDVRMEFYDDGSVTPKFTAIQHQYTRREFEHAAARGGMVGATWKPLFAAPEALAQRDAEFWRRCHATQPYALFVTRKPLQPTGRPWWGRRRMANA